MMMSLGKAGKVEPHYCRRPAGLTLEHETRYIHTLFDHAGERSGKVSTEKWYHARPSMRFNVLLEVADTSDGLPPKRGKTFITSVSSTEFKSSVINNKYHG